LATPLHIVPGLIMHGDTPPCLHASPWHSAQLSTGAAPCHLFYFYLYSWQTDEFHCVTCGRCPCAQFSLLRVVLSNLVVIAAGLLENKTISGVNALTSNECKRTIMMESGILWSTVICVLITFNI
jgi:hypothetical protein